MKILMVLDRDFPPDIRVGKEASALISAGHEIHLLCPSENSYPKEELYKGINIHRIMKPKNPYTRIFFLPTSFTFIWTRLWKRKLRHIIEKHRPDVLHTHDLPLSVITTEIAKQYGIPNIVDLHENYPAAAKQWASSDDLLKTIYYNVFLNPVYFRKIEINNLEKADYIITVIDEMKDRLADMGIKKEKIYVVKNTENIDEFLKMNLDNSILPSYDGKYPILYVGGFGRHRGIDVAIEAMVEVKRKCKNAVLVIVGGNWKTEYEKLKKLSQYLNVDDVVEFTGKVPFEKVPSFVRASRICLVPHRKSEHTDNTIPHKLFQYMVYGKPVIVSDCKPLKRIVNELKSGLVFSSGNSDELGKAIIKLYNDRELEKNLCSNAKTGVKSYDWKKDASVLCDIYDRIEKSRNS